MENRNFSRQDITAILIGFGLVAAITVFFVVKTVSKGAPVDERTASISPQEAEANGRQPEISVDEARKQATLQIHKTLIIDTRAETEYKASHIVDSTFVPLSALESFTVPTGITNIFVLAPASEDDQKEIGRIFSEKEIRYLFIKGGIDEWVRAGGQTISFGNPSSQIDISKTTLVTSGVFTDTLKAPIKPFVIDIRSEQAFGKSRIPGAKNISLSDIEKRRGEIPPATTIALYGEDPIETFQASVRLFDLGFYSVKTLDIRFSEWESKGNPVEK